MRDFTCRVRVITYNALNRSNGGLARHLLLKSAMKVPEEPWNACLGVVRS